MLEEEGGSFRSSDSNRVVKSGVGSWEPEQEQQEEDYLVSLELVYSSVLVVAWVKCRYVVRGWGVW